MSTWITVSGHIPLHLHSKVNLCAQSCLEHVTYSEKTRTVFSSVAQSCPTLCNPMGCSMPGFPVHHQLPELAQTHVHRVSDAIQPSHPKSPSPPPSFPASGSFPMSQLFPLGGQSIGASSSASVLPMNIQG